MKQYYQLSETGYPVISPIQLEGFTEYEVGLEPAELSQAITNTKILDSTNFTNANARESLANSDWEVIRTLERMFLNGTPINITREQLRALVK